MSALPTTKYAPGTTHTIPARSGVAVPLKAKQTVKVINTHGTQVIDTWAIIPPRQGSSQTNPTFATRSAGQTPQYEYMSMCHTRASALHLSPLPGDILVTNTRTPILQMLEDTTAPKHVHDTLIAACDIHRYHELGVSKEEYHENCSDNFRGGLAMDVGIIEFSPSPPDPLNLWMNIPVQLRDAGGNMQSAGGDVSFEAPVSKKGDYVVLKALQDCIVVMSACPQDILKINNEEPTEAHFEVGNV
ncbi:hypothetical protein LTR70_009131 [Exophiala xenobiotica]|uniref:DUF1989 domain-containing protein n=1 Tax=Lithohypha guttulata TaxID=1690604 RepID=A0ABR0K0S5_9EURO|nr:hypothetical protein LTR24_008148 [Lithohypha guttulata]KAK5310948.1 hypothetical protein LTR70_009131 [Exophiala xenobiotica]